VTRFSSSKNPKRRNTMIDAHNHFGRSSFHGEHLVTRGKQTGFRVEGQRQTKTANSIRLSVLRSSISSSFFLFEIYSDSLQRITVQGIIMAENDEKEDKKELPADPATYTADKVITTNANPPPPVDPSTARKRRKAIIESQRKETEEAALQQQQKELENEGNKTNKSTTSSVDENNGDGDDSESEGSMQPNGKKRRVKKTQIRYDPDVPMSKEQLAAWRREARRVRNRESAAASRQRIRSRITELETEVDEYKSKYHAALDRLKELEEMAKNNATNAAADGETVAASEGETTGV